MAENYTRSVGTGTGPVLLLNRLFVGSSTGRVYQLDLATGNTASPERQVDIDLSTAVGSLSTETGAELLVGSENGTISKILLDVNGLIPAP